ncbi:11143_t:CDS:1, partial [Ambispora leptoticha]
PSSQAERIERTAMMFRRLAGWKSRPKRLETMYMDRYMKLNEQKKKEEAQKLKEKAEGKPYSTGQN